MKLKNVVGIILALLVGVAIGVYLGRDIFPKSRIVSMRFNSVGGMIVRAGAKDELHWTDGNNVPVPVGFKFGLNPCEAGTDPAKGTCKLKDSSIYKFGCTAPGCPDPAVGGGDDTSPVPTRGGVAGGHLDPPYATPNSVDLYCSPVTSSAAASTIVKGNTGDGFTLEVIGASDFTATFPANTCKDGDTLNNLNPNCRILPVVRVDLPIMYKITVGGCTNPGMATLTVLALNKP